MARPILTKYGLCAFQMYVMYYLEKLLAFMSGQFWYNRNSRQVSVKSNILASHV